MTAFFRRVTGLWVAAILLSTALPFYTLAQESGSVSPLSPPPLPSSGSSGPGSFSSGSGSSGASMPSPLPPPPSGTNFQMDGANFQKDGSNFQRDGADFQKDGANFQRGSFQNGLKQGQPSQFGESQPGMSGEEMDARQSEQEQKMKERHLKQLQRGMKQFGKMLDKFKVKIDKLAAQGIPVPTECKDGVEQSSALVQSILTATDPEIVDSVDQSDLQSAGEVMQVCGPKIEQLTQLPRILKQVNAEVKKLEKKYESVGKRAKASGLEADELLNSVAAVIAELKSAIETIKSGGEDDAFAALEDLRGKFEEAHLKLGGIEALFQMQKSLKSFNGQLTRFDRAVKKIKDTEERAAAQAKLDELKSALAQLKGIKLTNDNDEEALDLMQRAWELRDNLEEELNINNGGPSFFQFQGGGSGGGSEFSAPQLDKLILEHRVVGHYFARNNVQPAQQYAGVTAAVRAFRTIAGIIMP